MPPTDRPTTIDVDFVRWTGEQADLLRRRAVDRLDLVNLAEEVAQLGVSQQNEIEGRLQVVLINLLRWQVQADKRSNGWTAAIIEQRAKMARALKRSPSLKRHLATVVDEEYRYARLFASGETGLPLARFPASCPFSVDQVLDFNFMPG